MDTKIEEGQVLRFSVRGSKGDEYTVIFAGRDGEVASSCSCMAGRMGHFCKHRVALLDGDVSDLLSDNEQQVVQLRSLIEGTDLEIAHREAVRVAASGRTVSYRALEQASRAVVPAKAWVRVVADVAGTGIKAGMVGKVVETQTPEARGTSWTNLAPAACLVKFLKDDLDEWAARQPVRPAHLPVKAELWLKIDEIEIISREEASI